MTSKSCLSTPSCLDAEFSYTSKHKLTLVPSISLTADCLRDPVLLSHVKVTTQLAQGEEAGARGNGADHPWNSEMQGYGECCRLIIADLPCCSAALAVLQHGACLIRLVAIAHLVPILIDPVVLTTSPLFRSCFTLRS